MWKERIGNFLSSIPTDFPNLFWLVKWLRVHKVFKSKNRTRNGKPCSRSSPTNGKYEMDYTSKSPCCHHLAYNGEGTSMHKERHCTNTEAGQFVLLILNIKDKKNYHHVKIEGLFCM